MKAVHRIATLLMRMDILKVFNMVMLPFLGSHYIDPILAGQKVKKSRYIYGCTDGMFVQGVLEKTTKCSL